MRYALALLVVAVLGLLWWATRERPRARATAARPAPEEPIADAVASCFPPADPDGPGLLFVGRVVGGGPGFRAEVVIDVHGQGVAFLAALDADGAGAGK